jgi:phosphoserine phosphatase RsbU/P
MINIARMNKKILFVDDDQELLLTYKMFFKSDYEVTLAESAEEALSLINSNEPFAVVVSDYRMSGMTGVDFLKKVKEVSSDTIRIIITSQTDIKTAIKAVNESNIFRFIPKPFRKSELQKAISDSIELYRIITSEKELNRKLADAYKTIQNDLESAANLQRSLQPKQKENINGVEFNSIFLPSVKISGDTYNYFALDEDNVGFYILDVAGHGIKPSLLSFALSIYISPVVRRDSPLFEFNSDTNDCEVVNPKDVISKLNKKFLTRGQNMDYFTISYGIINKKKRELRICNAAHPVAVKCNGDKAVRKVGVRNFPVGVFEDVEFREEVIEIGDNDKLLMYSDGLIECKNQNDEMFGIVKLVNFISNACPLTFDSLTEKLKEQLILWRGNDEFQDDITFFTIEIKEPKN